MEVFGYWKCVVVLVFAVVQIGEGSLQCNLTCPNQQLSCTTSASNKQFLLKGHSLHGQKVKLEPLLMDIPASLVELAVEGCAAVEVMPRAFEGHLLLQRLNFSNIEELTFQEDSLVFTGDLTLNIDQVSSLELRRRAITFNASRGVAEQRLQVTNTQLSSVAQEAITAPLTSNYLTTFGDNNTLSDSGDLSGLCSLRREFREVFVPEGAPGQVPCSATRALGSLVVFAVALLCRKGL